MRYEMITVDPGWSTGIALWGSAKFPSTDCITLDRKIESTEERLLYMWDMFESLLLKNKCSYCVIETTEFWSDSLKSVTSHKRGDVHILSILIGGYANIVRKFDIPFILILAREWKGNMNDMQVKNRVAYVLKKSYKNPHICDAVGIGLSVRKLFNVRRRSI